MKSKYPSILASVVLEAAVIFVVLAGLYRLFVFAIAAPFLSGVFIGRRTNAVAAAIWCMFGAVLALVAAEVIQAVTALENEIPGDSDLMDDDGNSVFALFFIVFSAGALGFLGARIEAKASA